MRNIRYISILLLAVFSFSACTSQKKDQKNKEKKIVFIPGTGSHGVGEHEFLGGCTLLARLINENVPGVHAIVTEQGWPKDTTVLNDADAIVMYCDGGGGHMAIPHLHHLDMLMNKGVGLVNLHYAVEVPKGEVGDDFLRWVGGYFEENWSVNPYWHAKFDNLPHHPVTNGVKPFETSDEWYYHMRFVQNDKNLVPILSTLPPASSLDRPDGDHSNNPDVREAVLVKKEPQVMSWAFTRPNGGRGFSMTGGHVHNNWKVDDYRKLVLNGILWAAKVKVPENGVVTPTPTQSELDALLKKPK